MLGGGVSLAAHTGDRLAVVFAFSANQKRVNPNASDDLSPTPGPSTVTNTNKSLAAL